MGLNPLGGVGRFAPWLLPIAIAAGFVALWWLKQEGAASASVVARVLAISLMAYTVFFSYMQQRRLDEVQVASQGFASRHGWAKGTLVAVLLLMLPPVQDWLVDLVNIQSTGSAALTDRRAVELAFAYGAALVVALQGLGYFIAVAIWWRRVGGMGERS
jgi:uncharacterized protein YjeT (DUF2065 family)